MYVIRLYGASVQLFKFIKFLLKFCLHNLCVLLCNHNLRIIFIVSFHEFANESLFLYET